MKRTSIIKKVLVLVVVAVVGAFAAAICLRHAMSQRMHAFVDLGVGALEEAAQRFADADYVLNYDATGKTFAVRPRDESAAPDRVLEAELGDFLRKLAPKPVKLAVSYKESDFSEAAGLVDFERRVREMIAPTGVEVLFVAAVESQTLKE